LPPVKRSNKSKLVNKMALPIAPLGQMATINLPNYVPNTVVPDRNPLNLALAAFLSGAAGSAGQALVNNTTARDYAGQFGEKEATGMDRVLRGPNVNAQQAGQRRSEKAINERLDKEIAAVDRRLTKQLGEQGRQFDVTTQQTNRRLDQTDAQIADSRQQFDTTRAQTNRRLDQSDEENRLRQREMDTRAKEVDARLAQLVEEGKLTRARAEQIAVEMGKTKEETRMIRGQNDFLDERRRGGGTQNPLAGARMPGSETPDPMLQRVMGVLEESAKPQPLAPAVPNTLIQPPSEEEILRRLMEVLQPGQVAPSVTGPFAQPVRTF
jgi:hypothetical protein